MKRGMKEGVEGKRGETGESAHIVPNLCCCIQKYLQVGIFRLVRGDLMGNSPSALR